MKWLIMKKILISFLVVTLLCVVNKLSFSQNTNSGELRLNLIPVVHQEGVAFKIEFENATLNKMVLFAKYTTCENFEIEIINAEGQNLVRNGRLNINESLFFRKHCLIALKPHQKKQINFIFRYSYNWKTDSLYSNHKYSLFILPAGKYEAKVHYFADKPEEPNTEKRMKKMWEGEACSNTVEFSIE